MKIYSPFSCTFIIAPCWLLLLFLWTAHIDGVQGDNVIHMHADLVPDSATDTGKAYRQDQRKAENITFSFAKHFQSHMVLQKAPHKANIYGFSPEIGQRVDVSMFTTSDVFNYSTTVKQGSVPGVGIWSVTLDAMKANEQAFIYVESNKITLQLEDVLFGDVWLCSGQSNMQFMVEQIFGAAEEIANAYKYPHVRFMNVYREGAENPLDDLIAVDQNWTAPTNATVAHFSAVCWLYGKALNEALGYPIGLVGTDYGGTPVESWSSPEALAKCGVNETNSRKPDLQSLKLSKWDEALIAGTWNNSVLWNAMVHPMLGMTIYGTIWYQGEADAITPEQRNRYNCTFPAMIDDWRLNFNKASGGQTDSMFPFGFVQLATSMPPENPFYPDIRWHQTADVGYVPNKRLREVFMAVALDLPDFDSPSGPVHTRHKKEVGARLALSGLAVAYKKEVEFQGPFPISATSLPNDTIVIDYGQSWTLNILNNEGFEVLCTSGNHSAKTWWLPTGITGHTNTKVMLLSTVCGKGQKILGLRYNWQTTPCALKTCAVYSTDQQLPAPPFVVFAERDVNENLVFNFRK